MVEVVVVAGTVVIVDVVVGPVLFAWPFVVVVVVGGRGSGRVHRKVGAGDHGHLGAPPDGLGASAMTTWPEIDWATACAAASSNGVSWAYSTTVSACDPTSDVLDTP